MASSLRSGDLSLVDGVLLEGVLGLLWSDCGGVGGNTCVSDVDGSLDDCSSMSC